MFTDARTTQTVEDTISGAKCLPALVLHTSSTLLESPSKVRSTRKEMGLYHLELLVLFATIDKDLLSMIEALRIFRMNMSKCRPLHAFPFFYAMQQGACGQVSWAVSVLQKFHAFWFIIIGSKIPELDLYQYVNTLLLNNMDLFYYDTCNKKDKKAAILLERM